MQIFLQKLPNYFANLLGCCENHNLLSKSCWGSFWAIILKNAGTFYSNIWSHCSRFTLRVYFGWNCLKSLTLYCDSFLDDATNMNEQTNKQTWTPPRLLWIEMSFSEAAASVTRLGAFWKFLMTNLLAKVAQIFGNCLGYFEKTSIFTQKVL